MKNRAFTLLELIVSIAICAVLVMLLSSGMTKVRTVQRRTVSMGNLRQLGMASFAYAADHNGQMPASMVGGKKSLSYGNGLQSGHATRKLFSVTKFSPVGQGDFDYLTSPACLYSPFSKKYQPSGLGQFYTNSGSAYLGYLFYSLFEPDESTPARSTPVAGLSNDRLTSNPRAPLYSDFCTVDTIADALYTDTHVHVLYLSGEVRTFESTEILKFRTWAEIFKRFSDSN